LVTPFAKSFSTGSIVWIVKRHIAPIVRLPMSTADSCRKLAIELRAKATNEPSSTLAAEWEHLGRAYLRLAEQDAVIIDNAVVRSTKKDGVQK
jgi:hypothetical protein